MNAHKYIKGAAIALAGILAFSMPITASAAEGTYGPTRSGSINAGHVSGSYSVTTTRSQISVYSFSSTTYCNATQDTYIVRDAVTGINTHCSMIATGSASNTNDYVFYRAPSK